MKIRNYLVLPILVIMLSACSFSLAEDITPPPGYQEAPQAAETQAVEAAGPLYPLVPPDPAAGQATYTEKCAPCHGDTGQGDGPRAAQLPNPVAALGNRDLARQARPADWYRTVTQGNMERFMPGFTSLSDRQRWDVVAYAYSLSQTEEGRSQGEALYKANCASCHGEQGQGGGSQTGSLTTVPEDLTNLASVVNRSAADNFQAITEGVPPDMPAYASQLSETDRWALADYLISLGFSGPRLAQSQPTLEATSGSGAEPTASVEVTATAVTSPTIVIGTVSGQVTNSSGGEIPAGATVTLYGYDEMTQVLTQTTTLPGNGLYTFDGVEMPTGRVFLVTVDFQDTIYPSEIAHTSADTSKVDLPVEIFETTTDTSSLVVERLHLFFEPIDEKTLNVVELYILSNNGTKTVAAAKDGEATLNFDLPEGATNLELQDGQLGDRFIQTESGFADTVPIRPGSSSYQVLFAFELPYNRKLDLVQKANLTTNAVVALVPEGGIKIKGDTVEDAGSQDVQGATYHIYNVGNLKAGEDLKLNISGQLSAGGTSLIAGSNQELVISLAVFGAVLIFAGVWLYLRNRPAKNEDDEEGPETDAVSQDEDADTIMDGILALDDLYKAGELPEDAYLKRRAELKNRLKNVMGSD